MNDLTQDIERLRRELEEKKREIRDLRQLVRREVDRDFSPDIREYSERELEDYFRDALGPLNEVSDPRPDPQAIRSHRKIIGPAIVFLKRAFLKMTGFYVHLLLDDQTRFNQRSAELAQALVARVKRYRERLEMVEGKVGAFEESLVILRGRLDDLRLRLPQPPGSGDDPARR
jgi:hypothetical protein